MIKINELLAGDDNALFLLSLPISTFWHVFLIFLRLYVECTILVLLSNIPFLQAYLMAVSVDGGFLGRWIVGLCFTCLPITGIASLAGIFLALILCSVKNSNLLHSMIMLAVLFVMGLLVGNSIGNVSNAVSMHKDQSEIIRAICANYSFGRMYQNGVVENNGAFFFLFLVASSVWFLSSFYLCWSPIRKSCWHCARQKYIKRFLMAHRRQKPSIGLWKKDYGVSGSIRGLIW